MSTYLGVGISYLNGRCFLIVPEDGEEEEEGGSSNEENNPGSSPAPVLKSSKSKGKSVGIPNPKKLLDVGKRMGRRATLMLDQGILLKSDKLAAAAANWEKTQGQTGVADGPKVRKVRHWLCNQNTVVPRFSALFPSP